MKLFTHSITRISLILLLLLAASACSTKKNTFTRRVYHNLNAHFNTYFNGKESLKAGVLELRNKTVDDYNRVLPVENLGSVQDAQSVNPYMDKAIEKGVKAISRHSMYFKSVEYNRWIDDSYHLIGKAYFYKQDYEMAGRTFDFIVKRYRNNDIKYDAMIWLARNHTQKGEFDQAITLLDMVNEKYESGAMPKKYAKNLEVTFAEYYLTLQNYPPAIEHLIRAIRHSSKKYEKNRYRFILAQIYQGTGNLSEAARLYSQVIRKNPPYEMAFKAMINKAKCYDAATGSSKEILKQLNKMLADEKNKEYQDQIYFALAEIALKENKLKEAKEYLALSVKTSVTNDYQKGLSALHLADIHYEVPDYKPSQAYYDTAVQFLPKDYENYANLETKSQRLNQLVGYIVTIETEDSLQHLASLTDKERDAIIQKKIEELKELERQQKREEGVNRQGLGFIEQANRQRNFQNQGGGNWYFYNPSALSFGFTEFQKKWGRRKLEDNWRLSNKAPVMDFGEEGLAVVDSSEMDSTLVPEVTDPKDKNYYLQYIPLTPEKMAVSHEKIKEALYNLGMLYDKGFNDLPKSINAYDTLLARYPGDSVYELKTAYQLYRIFDEQGKTDRRDHYKNLIITKYPESDYAMIILDPDYYKKIIEEKGKEKRLYRSAYLAFNESDYAKVLSLTRQASKTYDDADLIPKFYYLEALTLGKTQSIDSMIASLEHIVSNYPSHDVSQMARDILARLNGNDTNLLSGESTLSISGTSSVAAQIYKHDPTAIHLFVMVADIRDVNINALKIRLSDFNQKYYGPEKLSVSSLFLNETEQIITISNFPNQQKAMTYYTGITGNAYVTSQLEGAESNSFIISVDNYPPFYKDKNVASYMEFFRKNYLGQ